MNQFHQFVAWIKNTLFTEKTLKLIWAKFMWIGARLRPRERFKKTKAYAALMQMPPLKRRMVVMLFGVFILLGLIFAFNQLKTFMFNQFMAVWVFPPLR